MKQFIDIDRYEPLSHRVYEQLLLSLLRRKLAYDTNEMVEILTLLIRDSIIPTRLPVISILSNVERHVAQQGLSNPVRQQLQRLTEYYHSSAVQVEERKAGERIAALLKISESSNDKKADGVDHPVTGAICIDLGTGEAWTNALLADPP